MPLLQDFYEIISIVKLSFLNKDDLFWIVNSPKSILSDNCDKTIVDLKIDLCIF